MNIAHGFVDTRATTERHGFVRATSGTSATTDAERARALQSALWALARHSPSYARVLAGRSGVRLASHLVTGDVAELTPQGRNSLIHAQELLRWACEIRPGLDTNQFMDALLGRDDPSGREREVFRLSVVP